MLLACIIVVMSKRIYSEQSFGALLDSGFESEASSPLRYHPYIERDNYMEHDFPFQQICCFTSDKNCMTYTRQRVADNCQGYRPSEFGES